MQEIFVIICSWSFLINSHLYVQLHVRTVDLEQCISFQFTESFEIFHALKGLSRFKSSFTICCNSCVSVIFPYIMYCVFNTIILFIIITSLLHAFVI